MTKWLEGGAALTAFVAAVFWFLSAYGALPKMVSYFDQAPQTDPFFMAVKYSAMMNRWAAGFSGVSALLISASLFRRK